MLSLCYCSFFLAYVAGSVDGAVALKYLDRGTDRDLGLVLILSSISLGYYYYFSVSSYIGPLTGKLRELVDTAVRRRVNILCVQETK